MIILVDAGDSIAEGDAGDSIAEVDAGDSIAEVDARYLMMA